MEPNIRAADAARSGITRAPFLPHPHATHALGNSWKRAFPRIFLTPTGVCCSDKLATGRLETHPAVFSQLSCVILTACRASPSATGLEISLPPAPARSRSSRVAARCHQAPASYVAPAFDAGRPELVRLYAVVRGSYAFRTRLVRTGGSPVCVRSYAKRPYERKYS